MEIKSTSIENLLQQYNSIKRIIECLETIKQKCIPALQEEKRISIFLDAYDILNWFFPPGITFHDEHYSVVHNLWKTVEKCIPTPINTSKVQLIISPFSALEMFHLLKVKSDQLEKLRIPETKTMTQTYYNKFLTEWGNLFIAVNEIASILKDNPNKSPIINAFSNGHVKTLRDIMPSEQVNRGELQKIATGKLDVTRGYKYIIAKREKARPNASDSSIKLSAVFDMANLGMVTFLNEKYNELGCLPIITTHAIFTIFGWEQATTNPKDKAYSHSLLALYLLKGIERARDLKEFEEVIIGALSICKEYIKALNANSQFVSARETYNANKDRSVELGKHESIAQQTWKELFEEKYFQLEEFPSSNQRQPPSLEQLSEMGEKDWEKNRQSFKENAKIIEREANFVDPELVKVLVDKTELLDQILDYAKP